MTFIKELQKEGGEKIFEVFKPEYLEKHPLGVQIELMNIKNYLITRTALRTIKQIRSMPIVFKYGEVDRAIMALEAEIKKQV